LINLSCSVAVGDKEDRSTETTSHYLHPGRNIATMSATELVPSPDTINIISIFIAYSCFNSTKGSGRCLGTSTLY
jgi:hypothetical protein